MQAPSRWFSRSLIAVVLGWAWAGASLVFAGFTVSHRQILHDGAPFQVRGVCYNPAPIGTDPSTQQPYGDYYTAAYSALTARDLPLIRALGANVIRVYGWDPAGNHTAFLDACYNGGVDSVYVLVNRWIDPATNWANATAVNAVRDEFLQLDAGLSSHPAVLGLLLGNEVNAPNGNGTNAAFWSALNTIAGAVKAQTPSRLVSTPIIDTLPQIAARDAVMTHLDFWCVQTYRGTTLGSLFTDYAAASTRPLVLTEFGLDAYDQQSGQPYADNGAFVGTTVAGLWREIAAHAATCAGACVFEFADEWWKSAGSISVHDTAGIAMGGLPDGTGNEEWWGLYARSASGTGLDTLSPRATVAALASAWTPVVDPPSAPVLTWVSPPESQTIAPGGGVTFTAAVAVSGDATPADPTYQWTRDGVPIAGATGATLTRSGLTADDSGDYAVTVTAGATTLTSPPAVLLVATPEPGRLKNLSVRSVAGSGDAALVVGFVVAGGTDTLLVRGVGPTLADFGVANVLTDPELELFSGQTSQALAQNWADGGLAVANAITAVGAFPLPANSLDAALLATVDGPRSVHVRGPAPGVALAEVYEVGTGTGQLRNLSARTFSGRGDDVLVVGFVVDGNVPKQMLIRGLGPALTGFGVGGAVSNPQVKLFNAAKAVVAANDDWSEQEIEPVARRVGAFDLTPESHDAAMLCTIVPGAYSAHVSGVGGETGVAMVEVYEVTPE